MSGKAEGGWCESHGGYLGSRCGPCGQSDGTNDPAYEAAIALLDRVLDMGVARWHHSSPDDDSTIHEWLGLSADEYAAWAEGNANKLVALASGGPNMSAIRDNGNCYGCPEAFVRRPT